MLNGLKMDNIRIELDNGGLYFRGNFKETFNCIPALDHEDVFYNVLEDATFEEMKENIIIDEIEMFKFSLVNSYDWCEFGIMGGGPKPIMFKDNLGNDKINRLYFIVSGLNKFNTGWNKGLIDYTIPDEIKLTPETMAECAFMFESIDKALNGEPAGTDEFNLMFDISSFAKNINWGFVNHEEDVILKPYGYAKDYGGFLLTLPDGNVNHKNVEYLIGHPVFKFDGNEPVILNETNIEEFKDVVKEYNNYLKIINS